MYKRTHYEKTSSEVCEQVEGGEEDGGGAKMKEISRNIIICPRCMGVGDYIPTEREQRMKESLDLVYGEGIRRIPEERPCSYCNGAGRVLRVVEDRKLEEEEQRWIPVEENSMPEEGRMILVADSKGQVSSAMFHAKSQSFTACHFSGGNDDFLGQQIVGVLDFPTHWRPLPEGPRRKEEK